MSEKKKQNFGGPWTEEKLRMFTEYLDAYLTALKKQSFKKVYIDAFAGTGTIKINSEEEHVIAGSAKRVLSAKQKFDHYYFIEYDKKKVNELQQMIDTEFPEYTNRVSIRCGDANVCLPEILSELNWKSTRGLLFIDPFATAFRWESLEKVARTDAIDLWYLFPYSALNRMLTRNGIMDASWRSRINGLLGTDDWEREFYKDTPQPSLFTNEPEQEKDAGLDKISKYLVKRLKTVFPQVSEKTYTFTNNGNNPLFLFCFAVASKNETAQNIAIRIANHIISKHEEQKSIRG